MNEVNIPDPWANKRELSIDDGSSFEGGYDLNTLTLTECKTAVPNTVGCWRINGNFHVHVTEKPNWLQRKMTKFLLGWIWVDG